VEVSLPEDPLLEESLPEDPLPEDPLPEDPLPEGSLLVPLEPSGLAVFSAFSELGEEFEEEPPFEA